jgi:hypothetical protein
VAELLSLHKSAMPTAKPVRKLWIYFRSKGIARRLLRIEPAGDGSMYFTLGWMGRRSRVSQSEYAIPAGETSASIDFTKHVVAEFDDYVGQHKGYKASGLVLSKFGSRYHRAPRQIPPVVASLTLLETIYPGPFERFDSKPPRSTDLVVPRDFTWTARTPALNIEDLTGEDAYHIDVWQVPVEMQEVRIGPVVGALPLKIGDRSLLFVFVQDDNDRQRGWLDRTVVLSHWAATTPD